VREGEQVFNNYGPKSNEELLLGYGFTLPHNPDDVVALKLGARPSPLAADDHGDGGGLVKQGSSGVRHYVRRDGAIPQDLLDEMRMLLFAPYDSRSDERDGISRDAEYWERELELADQLGAMLALKLQALEVSELSAEERIDDDRGSKRPRFEVDGPHRDDGGRGSVDDIRPDIMLLVRDYRQGTQQWGDPV
jgi:hypothetical protein